MSLQFYLLVPFSYLFFDLFNRLVGKTTVPNKCQKPLTWANILTSFTHSFITGCGSLYVFSQQSDPAKTFFSMITNPQDITGVSRFCCIITVGYFIYDIVDMIKDTDSGIDYTLLVHHSMCILCFGLAIHFRIYRMYAMGALLHEVQSVFLHFRRLLNLAKIPRTTTIYALAKYANLVTFLVFRFFVNAVMIVDTYRYSSEYFFAYSVWLALPINFLFVFLNWDVFAQLMKSDFGRKVVKRKE